MAVEVVAVEVVAVEAVLVVVVVVVTVVLTVLVVVVKVTEVDVVFDLLQEARTIEITIKQVSNIQKNPLFIKTSF